MRDTRSDTVRDRKYVSLSYSILVMVYYKLQKMMFNWLVIKMYAETGHVKVMYFVKVRHGRMGYKKG